MDSTLGLPPRGARHGFAEVDVAGLVARGIGVREVVGDQFGAAPAHVERGGVYTEVLIETGRHGRSSCRRHRADVRGAKQATCHGAFSRSAGPHGRGGFTTL